MFMYVSIFTVKFDFLIDLIRPDSYVRPLSLPVY